MNDVAAYHILVCALFSVQGVMWTGLETTRTLIHDMLPHHS